MFIEFVSDDLTHIRQRVASVCFRYDRIPAFCFKKKPLSIQSAWLILPDKMPSNSEQTTPSSPSIPEKNSVAETNVASHVAPIRSAVNDSVEASQEMYAHTTEEVKNVVQFTRESIHSAGSKAYKGVRSFIRPIKQIFEDADSEKGTILRKQFAIAREHVNLRAYRAQVSYIAWRAVCMTHC